MIKIFTKNIFLLKLKLLNIMDFKKKVQSLSAKEIILSMVEGLRNPKCTINMDVYGSVDRNGTCYGCAATQTIMQIAGIVFDNKTIYDFRKKAEKLNTDYWFIVYFALAIDNLRKGRLDIYNYIAKKEGFATINYNESLHYNLSRLNNNYTEKELCKYIELSDYQL